MRKVLAYTFSGGGLRFGQHSATSKVLHDRIGGADIYLGVSAGAIEVMVAAMGLDDEIKEIATSKDILKYTFGGRNTSPLTKRGNIAPRAVLRMVKSILPSKKPQYLGDHEALGRTYSRIITREMFYNFTEKTDNPMVGVLYVNLDTAKRVVVWAHEATYEDWIRAVLASSCIPPFMTPIEINGSLCADGGLRDHSPSDWLLSSGIQVDELVEVFARPKKLDGVVSKIENNPFKVFGRMIEIMTLEISKSDEEKARMYPDLKLLQLYQPSVLKGTFDNNPERLQRAYDRTTEEIKKQIPVNWRKVL